MHLHPSNKYKIYYVTEIYRSFSLKMKTFGWLIEVIERHVPYFCLSIDFKTNGDGATVDDRSLQWHKAAAVAQYQAPVWIWRVNSINFQATSGTMYTYIECMCIFTIQDDTGISPLLKSVSLFHFSTNQSSYYVRLIRFVGTCTYNNAFPQGMN